MIMFVFKNAYKSQSELYPSGVARGFCRQKTWESFL